MKAVTKFFAGAAIAAVAAGGFAAPAAAQYYPGTGYGGGGALGAIIDSVLGAGRYGNNYQLQRYGIEQCARVAEQRLNGGYSNSGYGQYGYGYGQYGYNNRAMARVTNITRVERRSNGGLKVYGLASSGAAAYGGYAQPYGGYGQPYGGYAQPYGGYGQPYGAYGQQVADYRFNCKIDSRGRITDVDIDRNTGYYRY